MPEGTTTLTAVTSDPDGDVISHWWSVKSAPAGMRPVFATQGAADTQVSGLIAAGTYTFTLTVVDRDAYATRDVTVTVAPGSDPAMLQLVSPNGSETYRGGQQVLIRWTSSNLSGDVALELFAQGVWSPLAGPGPDDGMEVWTVPDIDADDCSVRLSAAGPRDESDGVFSISASASVDGGCACSSRPGARTWPAWLLLVAGLLVRRRRRDLRRSPGWPSKSR